MTIENVTFIGLGVMGYQMAGHLAKNNYKVTVYNRTQSKSEDWVFQASRPSKEKGSRIDDGPVCGQID